jgi:hypothetical protein
LRVAAAALAGAVLVAAVATPAFGIADRVIGLFDGTSVASDNLSADDLHALAALTDGVSPRLPASQQEDLARLGAASLRQIATRDGRAFYVATRRGAGLCVSVGALGATDPIGDILCARDFPSASRPVLDRSTFVGTPSEPHVTRLEGFAADGVSHVGVLTKSGDITALTMVQDNVYLRTEGLPIGAVAGIVAFDEDASRLYTACITGGCPRG